MRTHQFSLSLNDEPEEWLCRLQGPQVVDRVVDGQQVVVFGIDVGDVEGVGVAQVVDHLQQVPERLESVELGLVQREPAELGVKLGLDLRELDRHGRGSVSRKLFFKTVSGC